MHVYSRSSQAALDTCDPRLVGIFTDILPAWDHTIIEGHRRKKRQNEMVRIGTSTLLWPNSSHNATPSRAVDAGPYYPGEGIPWEDFERFRAWGGFVLGFAQAHGLRLRWGGDWDGDRLFTDQRLHDLPHFELIDP